MGCSGWSRVGGGRWEFATATGDTREIWNRAVAGRSRFSCQLLQARAGRGGPWRPVAARDAELVSAQLGEWLEDGDVAVTVVIVASVVEVLFGKGCAEELAEGVAAGDTAVIGRL